MFNKLLFTLTTLFLFSLSLPILAQSGYVLFTASGAINNTGGTVITGDIGTNAGAFMQLCNVVKINLQHKYTLLWKAQE